MKILNLKKFCRSHPMRNDPFNKICCTCLFLYLWLFQNHFLYAAEQWFFPEGHEYRAETPIIREDDRIPQGPGFAMLRIWQPNHDDSCQGVFRVCSSWKLIYRNCWSTWNLSRLIKVPCLLRILSFLLVFHCSYNILSLGGKWFFERKHCMHCLEPHTFLVWYDLLLWGLSITKYQVHLKNEMGSTNLTSCLMQTCQALND